MLGAARGAANLAPTHLDGHLGPEARAQLVNDLSVEAAAIVHVTHQHRECLWHRGKVRSQRPSYCVVSLGEKPSLKKHRTKVPSSRKPSLIT